MARNGTVVMLQIRRQFRTEHSRAMPRNASPSMPTYATPVPLRSVARNRSIVVSLFFGRPLSAPRNTSTSICFNSFLVLSSMVKSPSTICSSDGRVAYPFLLRPDARKNGQTRPLDCHSDCPLCRWSSAPRVCLAGMPEKRQHSRRFGSHLGNPGLSVTKRADNLPHASSDAMSLMQCNC
jgi:hypothetical protein